MLQNAFITPSDNNNIKNLYGNSPFHVRRRFTYSITYALPGRKSPGQILQGWSLNSIVTLETGMPWGVNDLTTDFSGTNEINSQSPNGEQWDFFGKASDFATTRDFINTNGGLGGIPYFSGTSNASCLAKAPWPR